MVSSIYTRFATAFAAMQTNRHVRKAIIAGFRQRRFARITRLAEFSKPDIGEIKIYDHGDRRLDIESALPGLSEVDIGIAIRRIDSWGRVRKTLEELTNKAAHSTQFREVLSLA